MCEQLFDGTSLFSLPTFVCLLDYTTFTTELCRNAGIIIEDYSFSFVHHKRFGSVLAFVDKFIRPLGWLTHFLRLVNYPRSCPLFVLVPLMVGCGEATIMCTVSCDVANVLNAHQNGFLLDDCSRR